MQVNKTKFERNISLEYYHMTCIGKKNIQAKEVYSCSSLPFVETEGRQETVLMPKDSLQ